MSPLPLGLCLRYQVLLMLILALCVLEPVPGGYGGLVVDAIENTEAQGGPSEHLYPTISLNPCL